MKIHVLPAGPIQTNAYLLTASERGEAVLIDAPEGIWFEIEPILKQTGCRLVELWLTHGHWDHTQGAAEVVRQSGVKVRAHRDDQPLIEDPELTKRFMGEDLRLEAVKVNDWVVQGEKLHVLGSEVEVRHVPGHCPGNVLFYFAGSKERRAAGAAFVGDALFANSIGRTDLPGGSFEVLEKAIRTQIYTLPDDTVVFPGHGPRTTVATEKVSNPYVHE
jgi:glyoxylase-like metal-dependent hydrolase (beta-lactamase superfamily II)